MDLFSTEHLELSESRRDALRSIGELVSASLEKEIRMEHSLETAGTLSSGIATLSRSADHASEIAGSAVQRSDEAERRLQILETSSQEITRIVEMIASIADQTNLLALNATIEAARAGSAGKGFAVVAAEVKDLATNTRRATGEVTAQINAVQAEISNVASAVASIREVVTEIDSVQHEVATVLMEQSQLASSLALKR
jgi:methyl-accepting chemotaxis protein